MFPCLMFGAFAVVVVFGIIWGIQKARERRDALARLAADLGLQFYPDDPWRLPERYGHFDLFSSGHSRRASNILAGAMDGFDVLAFDYKYTTGSGKNSHTYHFQAVVMGMPILAPRLKMRHENFLDTAASWVGRNDIDFESDQFSRRYHMACQVPKFAYDIFHARLIDYLLRCGDVPGLEMSGPLLLLYDRGSGEVAGSGNVANFRRIIAIGREIIRSIPDYVQSERGIQAQAGG